MEAIHHYCRLLFSEEKPFPIVVVYCKQRAVEGALLKAQKNGYHHIFILKRDSKRAKKESNYFSCLENDVSILDFELDM